MLPSPPCESLCAWVHCGNQHHVGEKVTVPTERLSVTYRPLAAAAAPQEFTA